MNDLPEVFKITPTQPPESFTSSAPQLPESFSISREPLADVPTQQELDWASIRDRYNRPLVKEDFLQDPMLQEVVYQSLEGRGKAKGNLYGQSRGVLTGLLGGSNVRTVRQDIREADFEDVFETWQNYQRSLNVGQSVTAANEVTYLMNQDDETKRRIGLGYLAFDSMDNAFTGAGTWKETGDAAWDYARGVVVDPINLVTFGLGKAISGAGTRVGMTALRQSLKAAANASARSTVAGKVGASALGATIKAAPYMAPDLALNVGSDALVQSSRIQTEVQKDFSPSQSAMVAAGTMLLPAVMGAAGGIARLRKSDFFKGTAFGAPDLSRLDALNLSAQDAWNMLKNNVDTDILNRVTDDSFGEITVDTTRFLDWSGAKREAGKLLDSKGRPLGREDLRTLFERRFWFGDNLDDGVHKGYYGALKDAGFEVTPSMVEAVGSTSKVFGQAIQFLDDKVVEKALKDFESVAGQKLGIPYTADGLAATFINRSTDAANTFQVRSQISRLERMGYATDEAEEILLGRGKTDAEDPKVMQYALSTYKRLLTSHLATTGANLKGFQQLVSLNTLSDIYSTVAYSAQEAFYKRVKGDPIKAAVAGNKAFASLSGALRRGAAVFTPEMESKYFLDLMDVLPDSMSEKVQSKLFRDVAGDGGVRDGLETFNLQGVRPLRSVEGATSAVQALTGVRLQDEVTKTWAFGANFDRSLARQFGVSSSEFFSNPANAFKLRGKEFEFALDEAVQRTLRETASVNWSLLPAKGAMRAAAKGIEYATNKTPIGFIVPFGSFMNTTIATMADLTGVNAIREFRRIATGKPLDYASKDFGELIGNAAAGWTVIGLTVPSAYEKIRQGLSYNQEPQDDGSIRNKQYTWPESATDLIAQMFAHAIVTDGTESDVYQAIETGNFALDYTQIPKDLFTELGVQASVGQAVRDLEGFFGDVSEFAAKATAGEFESVMEDLLLPIITRPVQGLTRPLDPVNTVVGVVSGNEMNPDLRQGSRAYNEMLRYVNNLLPESVTGVSDMRKRVDALRGPRTSIDAGRQILGNRTTLHPNLAEAMFNSAGIPTWKAVEGINAPPEVRNVFDSIAAPLFNQEAARQLEKHPDFTSQSQGRKEEILGVMRKNVREKALELLKNSAPKSLQFVYRLSNENQDRVKSVMEKLEVEGDLVDLLDDPDGLQTLQYIDYLVQNYDDLFLQDIIE